MHDWKGNDPKASKNPPSGYSHQRAGLRKGEVAGWWNDTNIGGIEHAFYLPMGTNSRSNANMNSEMTLMNGIIKIGKPVEHPKFASNLSLLELSW